MHIYRKNFRISYMKFIRYEDLGDVSGSLLRAMNQIVCVTVIGGNFLVDEIKWAIEDVLYRGICCETYIVPPNDSLMIHESDHVKNGHRLECIAANQFITTKIPTVFYLEKLFSNMISDHFEYEELDVQLRGLYIYDTEANDGIYENWKDRDCIIR